MRSSPVIVAARLRSLSAISFHRTIDKVDKLIGDGLAPTPVIISVIASDPMFSAAVLGQANSSGAEVTQLSQAVLQLGLSMVQGLTRTLVPMDADHHQLMAGYWSQANACAAMTRVVVGYRPAIFSASVDEETAHVAGLLHDLGSIVAGLHFSEGHARALRRLVEGENPLHRLIVDEVGVEPGVLGAQVAELWQLPELVATVTQHHRRPVRAPRFRELCCAVHLSRQLIRGCGFVPDQDSLVEVIEEEAMKLLDLGLTDVPRLLERFFAEMDDLESFEPVLLRT